ncbi:MAG: DUF2809 domain-containing protein [Bacteroidota bacterium]|nr:DUF2809 domain-containing protein [Bacteroidota bacterium]
MKRSTYIFIALITLVIGLASRKFGNYLPDFLQKYLGDAIWAMMIYWCFRFALYNKSLFYSAISAWVLSVLIEFLELYKAPWIKSIRATAIGGLILGYDFAWSDILCYTVGIALGFCSDKLLSGVQKRRNT